MLWGVLQQRQLLLCQLTTDLQIHNMTKTLKIFGFFENAELLYVVGCTAAAPAPSPQAQHGSASTQHDKSP
jgi:hypothetical protein